MICEDDAARMLELLEQIASKLNVSVRYEGLGQPDDDLHVRSGSCRFKGEKIIIVDKYKPKVEQFYALLAELKQHDLSKIYVAPAIRVLLEKG